MYDPREVGQGLDGVEDLLLLYLIGRRWPGDLLQSNVSRGG